MTEQSEGREGASPTTLADRLEQTWANYADEPRLAEIVVHNMILAEKVRLLTPQHTDTHFSRVRMAVEAVDRAFNDFLVAKEGGE